MRVFIGLIIIAAAAVGQESVIRITAQTLSRQTTNSMFGRLPKNISAVGVQVCNQSQDNLSIPQARIVQQVKATNQLTILPRDAAAVIVAAAQGGGWINTMNRAVMGGQTVEGGLISFGVIKPNTTLGVLTVGITGVASLVSQAVGGTAQTHAYLTLVNEMLQDPIQLTALGCSSGIALVESDPKKKSLDFSMPVAIPAVSK